MINKQLEIESSCSAIAAMRAYEQRTDTLQAKLWQVIVNNPDFAQIVADIHKVVRLPIKAEVMLLIALDSLVPNVLANNPISRTKLAHSVRSTISQELGLFDFHTEDKTQFVNSMQYSKKQQGRHRAKALIHAVNTHTKEFIFRNEWDMDDNSLKKTLHIVGHLEQLLSDYIVLRKEGARGKASRYVLTQAGRDLSQNVLDVLSAHTSFLPMCIPPISWDAEGDNGGYVSLRTTLVRGRKLNKVAGNVLTAVNKMQNIPFRISKPVLALLKEVCKLGGGIMGVPSLKLKDLPPQGKDMTAWKRMARDVYTENAKSKVIRSSFAQQAHIGTQFAEFDSIYFPLFIDWRGRIYPASKYVNVQSNDAGSSLIEFSEGQPIADWPTTRIHYLKAIASTYGNDKVSSNAMVLWSEQNLSAIRQYAHRPLSHAWSREADNPFELYGLCEEFVRLEDGLSDKCHRIIYVDGTCNGTQHISAILRDNVGAECVNLLPATNNTAPADIYGIIAKAVTAELESSKFINTDKEGYAFWLKDKINRKVVKRAVMTYPYGVTTWGIIDQMKHDLPDVADHWKNVDTKVLSFLAKLVIGAIERSVPSFRLIKDWFTQLVYSCYEINPEYFIRIQLPTGFLLINRYDKKMIQSVNCRVLGKRYHIFTNLDTVDVAKKKAACALMPNFIHALDASHLVSVVNSFDANIATRHDSFGTYATHLDELQATLRAEFYIQYTVFGLQNLVDGIARDLSISKDKLPQLPDIGKFNLTNILKAGNMFR